MNRKFALMIILVCFYGMKVSPAFAEGGVPVPTGIDQAKTNMPEKAADKIAKAEEKIAEHKPEISTSNEFLNDEDAISPTGLEKSEAGKAKAEENKAKAEAHKVEAQTHKENHPTKDSHVGIENNKGQKASSVLAAKDQENKGIANALTRGNRV